jgi:hypothetical protein
MSHCTQLRIPHSSIRNVTSSFRTTAIHKRFAKENKDSNETCCPHITSWSLRSVNVLSAVWEEYRVCSWTEDFLLVSDTGVVIHSLAANIGQFKHCNSLVYFIEVRIFSRWIVRNIKPCNSLVHFFQVRIFSRWMVPFEEPCIAARLAFLAGINS